LGRTARYHTVEEARLGFLAMPGEDRSALVIHAPVSVGGGRTVSTSDAVAPNVHYETIAQHRYANYLGWWLP
jgi:hypothetical protein